MKHILSFLHSLIPTRHVLSIFHDGREDFRVTQIVWLGRVIRSHRTPSTRRPMTEEEFKRTYLRYLRGEYGEPEETTVDGTGWEEVSDAHRRMGDALRRTGAPN